MRSEMGLPVPIASSGSTWKSFWPRQCYMDESHRKDDSGGLWMQRTISGAISYDLRPLWTIGPRVLPIVCRQMGRDLGTEWQLLFLFALAARPKGTSKKFILMEYW